MCVVVGVDPGYSCVLGAIDWVMGFGVDLFFDGVTDWLFFIDIEVS